LGSHCSANSIQKIEAWRESTRPIRGSRFTASASGPSSAIAMSVSPLLSMASRVVLSGTPLSTSFLTLGTFLQYLGNASKVMSMPGRCDTSR
jgi:hypothetical protein